MRIRVLRIVFSSNLTHDLGRGCESDGFPEGMDDYVQACMRRALTNSFKAIGPKVMLVEEAGQVLEAHILGSLVPSVQHLIMIGDPQQLRPTLNNYCRWLSIHALQYERSDICFSLALSMDHRSGSLVYKFDMSLMERLSSSGFPMSQIDVQRRMRPTISELVR